MNLMDQLQHFNWQFIVMNEIDSKYRLAINSGLFEFRPIKSKEFVLLENL